MSTRFAALDRIGLNLQAVFALDRLPPAVLDRLGDRRGYRQLVLVGNAGPALWRAVTAAATPGEHPIDDFSVRAVEGWLDAACGPVRRRRLYPGDVPLDLQALGRLAGWHHDSPFKVGIHPRWGTWFGYRVALLTDTALPATRPLPSAPPCEACRGRPCAGACPAGAIADEGFSLAQCIAYRRQPASRCAGTCVARLACPVGVDQRYDEAQIRHSYAESLRAIERYCGPAGASPRGS